MRFSLFVSLSLMGLMGGLFPGCGSKSESSSFESRCGNGVLEEGENCDSPDKYCSQDCQSELGSCGDGIVQTEFGETCEPGAAGEGGAGGGGSGRAAPNVGGSGGAAPNAGLHCNDDCRPEPGYVCDPDTNTCGQTGLESDELVEENVEAVCEYLTALLGGEGNSLGCVLDGESYQVVLGSVDDCVDDFEATPDCAVGELEQWTLDKSACEIALGEKPCIE